MENLVLYGASPFVSTSTTCKSPLPPLKFDTQKTVFLDLDDTLIHSVSRTCPSEYDFIVEYSVLGQRDVRYVLKRPFVDEFLLFLNQKNFEIVIFTAAIKEYASPILDRLDPKGFIAHRLYRDSSKILDGMLVKDISCFGRDLNNVVIIDDNPMSYRLQPENAIQITPFTDDLTDVELIKLMQYFEENRFLPEKNSTTPTDVELIKSMQYFEENRFLPEKNSTTPTAMPSADDFGLGEVTD